jgi:hypothetical protein
MALKAVFAHRQRCSRSGSICKNPETPVISRYRCQGTASGANEPGDNDRSSAHISNATAALADAGELDSRPVISLLKRSHLSFISLSYGCERQRCEDRKRIAGVLGGGVDCSPFFASGGLRAVSAVGLGGLHPGLPWRAGHWRGTGRWSRKGSRRTGRNSASCGPSRTCGWHIRRSGRCARR